MTRAVWFSKACDDAALQLGGYEKIDASLDAFWDALQRNPYGFPSIQVHPFSAKYIVTKPFKNTPAAIWIFTISMTGDVTFDHVEIYENY